MDAGQMLAMHTVGQTASFTHKPKHFALPSLRPSDTSDHAIVVVVSQNCCVLVFTGYRTIIARYVAK